MVTWTQPYPRLWSVFPRFIYTILILNPPTVHLPKIYRTTLHANHSNTSYYVHLEKYWTLHWPDFFLVIVRTSIPLSHRTSTKLKFLFTAQYIFLSQQLRTLKKEVMVMVMVPLGCVCLPLPLSSCCLQCSYNWWGCSRGVGRDETAAIYSKLQYITNGYCVVIVKWCVFWHCIKESVALQIGQSIIL